MPLHQAALQSGLTTVAANPPATVAACAQAWADAVGSYASAIVPASATGPAATAGLASSLASAFSQPAAASAMEAAFAAFAVTLGGGMAGHAPVPPPGPVGFAGIFAQPQSATHATAATAVASAIDTWLRTGIGTLIAPPNTAIPWS